MFTIHRSERTDALVDALASVISAPLDDAFSPEVVAVPTRGVERWLTHRLGEVLGATPGRRDGVCANVEFPFPGRLVGDALADATGIDRHEDPWRPERLVWPLLDVLDEHVDEPWLAMLASHLGHGDAGAEGDMDQSELTQREDARRRERRFATVRHLAELFDRYAVYRPALIHQWLAADPTGPFRNVPDDAQWQPRLWRALRDRVGSPSPPERIEQACAAIRDGTAEVDLPARLSLFGLTRLPATYLEVLRALAVRREIHLYALHPSLTLWDRISAAGTPGLPLRRVDDPTRALARNPLLRTWATDTREMQLVLSAAADAQLSHRPVQAPTRRTLLERVQDDIREDRSPPGRPVDGAGDERHLLGEDDRSIQVHACHGRARQVEVARDAILHALADDPTLEPRDVIVLCPDIDEFAPLLHATFGGSRSRSVGADRPDAEPGGSGDPPELPYRLADRSLRQTNPLLSALDTLLEMIEGRLTASEVVAFLGREPVRARFRVDDDDIDRIAEWVASSQIRWGLDAARRTPYWLGDVDENTWRTGLDRVLLGVAMTTDGSRMFGGRLPLDDVESGDVDLVGRFAELIDRIDTVVTAAAESRTVDDWARTLAEAVDLLMVCPPGQTWQRVQVDGMLRELVAEATTAERVATGQLSLAELRALLAHRLRGVPTRADFRTGAITMCTLVPMRAVPHRVVCILGLDDGAFPRTGRPDGDDLLRRDPLVGDHDPRLEDRQLLLDAVLAATDRLIVTTTGADVRTNEHRPPAVPLSELLEVVDRTARLDDGSDATTQVLLHHPLHAFDPAAHDRRSGRPWAFDPVSLAGSRALCGPRDRSAPFLDGPLPPAPSTDLVLLDDLVRFVQHPMREFLRQRLAVNVWEDDRAFDDAIPVELDSLEAWKVGQRLLERLLGGVAIDDAVDAELAVGALPPRAMGTAAIEPIADTAVRIHAIAVDVGLADADASRDVDVTVPVAGRDVSVVGTVAGVGEDIAGQVSYSSIGARHRLAAWVRLLGLSATHPDVAWRAVTVGRNKRGGRLVELAALGDDDDRRARAIALLARLVELRQQGLREPLPLPCKTAERWADARRKGRDPAVAAARDWTSGHRFPGEDADRCHQTVFGGIRRLDELLAVGPTAFESGPDWAEDETSRLGRLARRLWDPILTQERWR